MSPSGSSAVSVSEVTTAPRGPLRAHATACATASAGPSNTASTPPPGRLRTHPESSELLGGTASRIAEIDSLHAPFDDDS